VAGSTLEILAISSFVLAQGSAVSFGQASSPIPAGQPSDAAPLENIRLSDTASEEPHLAVDSQGRVFAGWKDVSSAACLGPNVFARSVDGGRTWSHQTSMALSDGYSGAAAGHSDPWLAIDEFDRIYYARDEGHVTDARNCGVEVLITVSRSDDGGLTWTPVVDVSADPFVDQPRIRSDGNGAVYMAYPANGGINLKRSVDGGATWSPTKIVAAANGLFLFGTVIAARPGGKVFVAFHAGNDGPGASFGNTLVVSSSDHGDTWGNAVRVNPKQGSAAASAWAYSQITKLADPSIVADSRGNLFVAWADRASGDSDILVSRSIDDGATWSSPVRINDAPEGDQWSVQLAVDVNDTLHAAWYDQRTGKTNLYYASSTNGGQTWSANRRVTTQEFLTRRVAEYFGLATDRDGTAYLAWTDGRDGDYNGPTFIYFARTTAPSREPVDRLPPIPPPRRGKEPPDLPPRN
jgi:hypothetical protein